MTAIKKRILAIEAHPDDLAYFYGGFMAKMVLEGHDVRVLTLTTGDQSTLDPALSREAIEQVMREEHRAAMAIIGVTDQRYILDGKFTNHFIFSSEQALELREVLIKEIRAFKPDTVVCFDIADVFEENPDHRLLARLGLQAAAFAAYPLVHPEHLAASLEPHFVARVLLAPTRDPNLFVDIDGEPLERKKRAGAAYRSQLDLMVTELDKRLRVMGMDPDLASIDNSDLWESVCDSMAAEAAAAGNKYHAEHPGIAPKINLEKAEAFRMQFLGAVEKVREFLPRECFTF